MDRAVPLRRPGSPSTRLPRRALLQGALGLAAAACVGPGTVGGAGGQGLPFVVFVQPDPLGDAARSVMALHRFAPGVEWLDGTQAPVASARHTSGPTPQWGAGPVDALSPPPAFAALEQAASRAGVDFAALLPGTVGAFTVPGGSVYALPVQAAPLGVLYNTAALHAARIRPPAPGWTIDDFEATCEAIAAAARAGRLPRPFRWALPPMVGRARLPMARGGTLLWYGALADADIWGAFVLGYGGSVARDGRFDLTGAEAGRGLWRLVAIARRYAAPVPRTDAERAAGEGGAVMQFRRYVSHHRFVGSRFARFPRLPVRPVNPLTPVGVGLVRAAGLGAWYPSVPPAGVPLQAQDAVVAYARWTWSLARRHPRAVPLPPPALADAAVQQAYWSAPTRAVSGAEALGDWRDAVVIQAGWPATGHGAAGLGRAADLMLTALTGAVTGGAGLDELLAGATQGCNAAAAQYRGAPAGA